MSPRPDRFIAAPARALAASPAALYDDWRLAETQASLALAAWYATARPDKAAAHARYAAHTDAEEVAATRLALRLGRAA